MKHPIRRATLAALATAAVVASVLITTNSGNAADTSLVGWAGSWSTGLVGPSPTDTGGSLTGFNDQSIRMIVHTSVGGEGVRLRFSNQFGAGPITIGHATVALPTDTLHGSADVVTGSIHELSFNGGSASTTMYKGADVVTDALNWRIAPNSDLAVTVFLPTATGQATWHPSADEQTFVYNGDVADTASGAGNTLTRFAFYFLAGVDVFTVLPAGGIVVLGDSVSNGNGATLNANVRWPDLLSKKINASHNPLREGVLNQSISGNAVTHDGAELSATTFGTSGLARLDTNGFSQINVRTVIVELGVNDINFYSDPADRIIGGLKQFAARLRDHGINAVVCTIGPFGGFAGPPGWSADKETVRVAVNSYIRSQHDFNYVIDLDAVLRDPADPTKILPAYNFDGIHPNDVGAQAIVNSVNVGRL